jgi:hypothetical protein
VKATSQRARPCIALLNDFINAPCDLERIRGFRTRTALSGAGLWVRRRVFYRIHAEVCKEIFDLLVRKVFSVGSAPLKDSLWQADLRVFGVSFCSRNGPLKRGEISWGDICVFR